MVFPVLVAGEIGGQTYNFEYSFPTLPTLHELMEQVEVVFEKECSRPITILKMQLYEEPTQKWIDLISGRQLKDGCQVYIFPAEDSQLTNASPSHNANNINVLTPRNEHGRSFTPGKLKSAPTLLTSHNNPQTTYEPIVRAATQKPTSEMSQVNTLDDKIRISFDELDSHRHRKATLSDLTTLLSSIQLNVALPIAEALFHKADYNADGHITYAEWCRFAQGYPKFIDSLCFRIGVLRAEKEQRAELVTEQGLFEKLKKNHEKTTLAFMDSVATKDEQEGRVRDAERAAANAMEGEVVIRQKFTDAESETSAKERELSDALADKEHAADCEDNRLSALSTSQRAVESASVSVTQAESQVSSAHEYIRQLQFQLDMAKKELQHQETVREKAQQDLHISQQSEAENRSLLADAQHGTQRAHDMAVRADSQLARARDYLREADAAVRESSHVSQILNQKLESEVRDFDAMQNHVAEAQHCCAQAEQEMNQQAIVVNDRADLLINYSSSQHQDIEEELLLIEEEIRLKDQRESLEARETQLGIAHNRFKNRDTPSKVRPSSPVTGSSRPPAFNPAAVSTPRAFRNSNPNINAGGTNAHISPIRERILTTSILNNRNTSVSASLPPSPTKSVAGHQSPGGMSHLIYFITVKSSITYNT